jgi:hypothetical protein
LHRRKRGTGTVFRLGSYWVALAPQLGGRGNAKQVRVAKDPSRAVVEAALDAWLNASGRIVRREGAERRSRSIR